VPLDEATVPTNCLEVLFDGQPGDLALVDIAVYDDAFVGARAVWDLDKVREIFTSRAAPHNIGLSSIGGCLYCSQLDGRHGSQMRLAPAGEAQAPGMVQSVRVSSFRLLEVGDEIPVDLVPSVLALDGEREIEISRKRRISVRFSDRGPRVVDVNRTLQGATQRSYFNDTALAGSEGQCLLAHLGVCLNPCPECE
jgi:hypothetical protein